ncbi:prenyltransferase [Halalkalirubrum salinum]|uniref:prenyltransferase n=1 Tax=Halalkalirubrum salinum TaxID=2563889 RepID=UPI00197A9574|nr:prenyltransferase [Halalkalirubrum salinum]
MACHRLAKTRLYALGLMARPDQLLLMIAVYAMGVFTAVAHGGAVSIKRLAIGFVIFAPVALGVHYANEYADARTDRLTQRTPFSGGSGAIPELGVSPQTARGAAVATGLTGVLVASIAVLTGVLALASGGLLVAMGVLGWAYSVGPYPLAWHGFGELDNALLGGIMLPVYGAAVATEGQVTLAIVATFLPFGFAVFCNLLATTWPDRKADAVVGKRTLATRWSKSWLRSAYAIGLIGILGSTALGWLSGAIEAAVTIGILLSLPVFFWGYTSYTRQRSPVPTVAAMLVFVTTFLLSSSVVLFG